MVKNEKEKSTNNYSITIKSFLEDSHKTSTEIMNVDNSDSSL